MRKGEEGRGGLTPEVAGSIPTEPLFFFLSFLDSFYYFPI